MITKNEILFVIAMVSMICCGVAINMLSANYQCVDDAYPFQAKLTLFDGCTVNYVGEWVTLKSLYDDGIIIK